MIIDPDKTYHIILKAGEDWADKKAAYEAFEDTTKSVLGEIASEFIDKGTAKGESEMRAAASALYRGHLTLKSEARKAYLFAQVKYDSLRLLADLRRSQESTRRAEINLR